MHREIGSHIDGVVHHHLLVWRLPRPFPKARGGYVDRWIAVAPRRSIDHVMFRSGWLSLMAYHSCPGWIVLPCSGFPFMYIWVNAIAFYPAPRSPWISAPGPIACVDLYSHVLRWEGREGREAHPPGGRGCSPSPWMVLAFKQSRRTDIACRCPVPPPGRRTGDDGVVRGVAGRGEGAGTMDAGEPEEGLPLITIPCSPRPRVPTPIPIRAVKAGPEGAGGCAREGAGRHRAGVNSTLGGVTQACPCCPGGGARMDGEDERRT